MRRFLMSLLAVAASAVAASAHFVFVLPDKDGKSVTVVFSDDLEVDENIPAERLKGLKLTGRFEGGSRLRSSASRGRAV